MPSRPDQRRGLCGSIRVGATRLFLDDDDVPVPFVYLFIYFVLLILYPSSIVRADQKLTSVLSMCCMHYKHKFVDVVVACWQRR